MTDEPLAGFDVRTFGALYARLEKSARYHFAVWLALMFPQNAKANFRLGKFQLHLAGLVQGMYNGTKPRFQSVSCPPQHGKSQMLAVRMVAWLVGAQPRVRIAMTGFSRSLLVDFLKEVKRLIKSATYQGIFPGVLAVRGEDRDDYVRFSNGSCITLRSAGSKFTGRGFDWLLVDDPHAGRAEAESKTQRDKVVQWFMADCYTRLSPTARILLIGTRWHPSDLIGHVTSKEFSDQLAAEGATDGIFHALNLPAIAEENDPMGRKEGEPLCPEYRPLSFLRVVRATLLGYEWDSLYRGAPRATLSGQVDITQLRYCKPSQVPTGLHQTRGWDLALSEKQAADYTAGVRLAYDRQEKRLYIFDSYRRRMAWARLRANMIRVSMEDKEKHGVHRIGVEGVSGFDAVYQEIAMQLAGEVSVVKKNPPKGGKLMRAQKWLVLLENGQVTLVTEEQEGFDGTGIRPQWIKDYVAELEQFPEGANDDQMDGTSIAFETLTEHANDLLLA